LFHTAEAAAKTKIQFESIEIDGRSPIVVFTDPGFNPFRTYPKEGGNARAPGATRPTTTSQTPQSQFHNQQAPQGSQQQRGFIQQNRGMPGNSFPASGRLQGHGAMIQPYGGNAGNSAYYGGARPPPNAYPGMYMHHGGPGNMHMGPGRPFRGSYSGVPSRPIPATGNAPDPGMMTNRPTQGFRPPLNTPGMHGGGGRTFYPDDGYGQGGQQFQGYY
jgi:hypothetical protein